MKLIAGRLPNYLINKWADVSYAIREKGRNPGLEDLAKFVKRQAAIKNDLGYAGAAAMTTTEKRENRKKRPNGTNDPPNPRQTSSFATDVNPEDTGRRLGTGDRQSKPPPAEQNCLCCSGSHELASCPELHNKDLQSRWDIVKRHRLCHVCMRTGHHRGRCESQTFCPCGGDKRHHRLLHNPPRRDTAETNTGNQTRKGGQQPSRKTPTPGMVSSRTLLKLGAQCSM